MPRCSVLAIALAAAWLTVTPEVGAQAPDGAIRAVPIRPVVPTVTEVADSLFWNMDARGALAVLEARLEVEPDDFETLWRAARAALNLGILEQGEDERLRLLRASVDHGDRALALAPDDPVALVWAAATKGRLAMTDRDPVTTARLGKEVWSLTESLLALEPNNPMGNDIRGKLIQELRKLSWAERVLARFLVGRDVAGEARWAYSEYYLQRAVERDPSMVSYRLDLGDTYRLQGKDALALQTYEGGLALPERYPVDAFYKRRILDGMRALGRERSGQR